MKKDRKRQDLSTLKQGQTVPAVSRRPVKLFIIMMVLLFLVIFHWAAMTVRSSLKNSARAKGTPPSVTSAWKNVEASLAQKKSRHHFGGPLPSSIVSAATSNVRGQFSVYVEDLKTGMWWGMKEKETYDAWSLMKVSTLVVLLKKAERQQLSLGDTIMLTPEELKSESPYVQHYQGRRNEFSIKELTERMIEDSDDAAAIALCKLLTFDEFQEGLRATAMPLATPPNQLPRISPSQYANLLRSLYFSDYLDRSSSDVALSLLSNTVFGDQLRAGIPREISLAHKVGFNAATGDSHDCGIVFLPNRPYVLCVMSTGTTKEESDRVMSSVSRQVYEFMQAGMPVVFNFLNRNSKVN